LGRTKEDMNLGENFIQLTIIMVEGWKFVIISCILTVGILMEVIMRKLLYAAVIIIGICGVSEGMMYSVDNVDLEIHKIQEKVKSAIPSSSFSLSDFKSNLNPEVSLKIQELLDSSLTGDDSSLECLSERIHAGLLNNKPIFLSSITIDQRDKLIYGLSMQILKDSIEGKLSNEASIIALKNILTYCKNEAKMIGLMELNYIISSIFLQIQYLISLQRDRY
jgi:hypothetical protein